ncbi:hypothetical protein P9139_18165 [Curtobacterium flaccumfaciens]|nr:hypothetical protein P9139_18165 [Curtobacterium flaccumfaciens]
MPKNQPNRYNPDTVKWEPITDAQAVAAAQTAATAVAAAQAAKDVADQANAAAGVAKQTADDANTAALQAAGIANGKGKVIYQASKPTGSNAAAGNLWIRTSDNTPWTYDTTSSDWVQVTDKTATDAAAAAVAAQQAATAAANAASAAQTTADGKPLILFSSTASPSGTAPTGSIWFLWDSAKNVAGQWLQEGTLASPVWTPQQIRSEVIANLDVGKLTAGSAAIANLVAQKIAASTANFQTANVSNLFVTDGATLSQAVIDFLFANVVQAKKITAGMIDVDSLNGVTLTGTILKTAASGQRLELLGTRLDVYSSGATSAASISGIVYGDSSAYASLQLKANGSSGSGTCNIFAPVSTTLSGVWAGTVKVSASVPSGFATSDLVLRRAFAGQSSATDTPKLPIIEADSNGASDDGTAAGTRFYGNRFSWVDPYGRTPRVIDIVKPAYAASNGVLPLEKVIVTAGDFQLLDGTSISADTGWLDVTSVASGYTSVGAQVRIVAGVFYGRGTIEKNSGVMSGSSIALCAQPSGMQRIAVTTNFNPVWKDTPSSVCVGWISTNGTINVSPGNVQAGKFSLSSINGLRTD